jgi:hypothetical protein
MLAHSQWLTTLVLLLPSMAQDAICPEPCAPDPMTTEFGNIPPGAELIFHFHSVSPGDGYSVIDIQTGTPICSTCTPCKAKLKFKYSPNGTATGACYSPDGGATWASTPSDVVRNVPVQTNCNEIPQEIRIDVASLTTPCGQSPLFFATARLGCHCDA